MPGKPGLCLELLKKELGWARAVDSARSRSTSGVWVGDWAGRTSSSPMGRLQLGESDVISFHDYSKLPTLQKRVRRTPAGRYERPILCTRIHGTARGEHVRPVPGSSSASSGSGRTTGGSSTARVRRFIPGIPGKSPTTPSRPSGSTT